MRPDGKLQRDDLDPGGPRSRRALLVEELAVDAVRIAHEHVRPAAGAAQRAVGDGEVVAHEIELGVARPAGNSTLRGFETRPRGRTRQGLLLRRSDERSLTAVPPPGQLCASKHLSCAAHPIDSYVRASRLVVGRYNPSRTTRPTSPVDVSRLPVPRLDDMAGVLVVIEMPRPWPRGHRISTPPGGAAWRSRVSLVIIVCLALTGSAAAQQTGSISGTVFDAAGAPVAGASVRVSGDRCPPAARRRPPMGAPTASRCCWPGSTYWKRKSRARLHETHGARGGGQGHAARPRDRRQRGGGGRGHGRHSHRRHSIDRGQLQLHGPDFQTTAAGAHLSRAVPADPRRRRQPQPVGPAAAAAVRTTRI